MGFIQAIHASSEALQASSPQPERFSVPSPMLVFILIRQEKMWVKGHRNNSNNEHFCGRQGGAWSPCPGKMAVPGISTKQDKIKEVIPGRRSIGTARSLQEAVSRQEGRKTSIKKPGREGFVQGLTLKHKAGEQNGKDSQSFWKVWVESGKGIGPHAAE